MSASSACTWHFSSDSDMICFHFLYEKYAGSGECKFTFSYFKWSDFFRCLFFWKYEQFFVSASSACNLSYFRWFWLVFLCLFTSKHLQDDVSASSACTFLYYILLTCVFVSLIRCCILSKQRVSASSTACTLSYFRWFWLVFLCLFSSKHLQFAVSASSTCHLQLIFFFSSLSFLGCWLLGVLCFTLLDKQCEALLQCKFWH